MAGTAGASIGRRGYCRPSPPPRSGRPASAYLRSSVLRYLEEALAESYAQLRVRGLSGVVVGVRFPIANGYVTVSGLAGEGIAIGNIIVGGQMLTVRVVQGRWEP